MTFFDIFEIIKTINKGGKSEEMVLSTLQVGAVFGEIALIDNKPRMASAKAISENVTLYVLSQNQFAAMLETTNPFIKKLLSILTDLVREKHT